MDADYCSLAGQMLFEGRQLVKMNGKRLAAHFTKWEEGGGINTVFSASGGNVLYYSFNCIAFAVDIWGFKMSTTYCIEAWEYHKRIKVTKEQILHLTFNNTVWPS